MIGYRGAKRFVALRAVLQLLHEKEGTLASPPKLVDIDPKLDEHGEEIIEVIKKALTKREIGKGSSSKKREVQARYFLKKLLNVVFPSYAYTNEKAVKVEATQLRSGPDRNKYLYRIEVVNHVWELATRSDYYKHLVKTNQKVARVIELNQLLYSSGSRRVQWRNQDGLIDEIHMEDDVELTIPSKK